MRGCPDRHGERARADVGLGEGERASMRIEDVGVEEIRRAGGERVRDPRDVPHRESSVAGVLRSSEVAHARRQRPRHQHAYRQRGGDEHDRVTAARGQRSSSRLQVPSIWFELSSSLFGSSLVFLCSSLLVLFVE